MRVHSGVLGVPAVVVHGGAGNLVSKASPAHLARGQEVLSAALDAAWEVLTQGGPALEAVVATVACLEASGRFNAGRGAVATSLGTVETDAAVMEGTHGKVGAICCATWPDSPVRAARAVMGLDGPTRGPVLLAGPGADRFCESAGLPRRDPTLLTGTGVIPISRQGTVGAVALDRDGHLAAATSTGGLLGKLPGRVGDSPIVGAGTWADDRSVAVSATGDGEAFLVAGFAHELDRRFVSGGDLAVALREALKTVGERGGHGGAIALGAHGRFAVGFDTAVMARAWRGPNCSDSSLVGETT
jgi:isoaspartyl peptidase/L-asparaginase-like protein (Ntn-hydrolase superfamily)